MRIIIIILITIIVVIMMICVLFCRNLLDRDTFSKSDPCELSVNTATLHNMLHSQGFISDFFLKKDSF